MISEYKRLNAKPTNSDVRPRKMSRQRRSIIINQLCELSRNGWQHAKPYDYEPLERELREASNPRTVASNTVNHSTKS